MFWPFGGKPRVLVMGSAHVDAIAERDENDRRIDIVGKVIHSLGGGAYNIAVNLARHRKGSRARVFIYTFIPKSSALIQTFLTRLRIHGVSTKHLQKMDKYDGTDLSLGGFVGVRGTTSKEIYAAATSSTIELVNPFSHPAQKNPLERLIKRCAAVAADTNFNANCMRALIASAHQHKVPLFVGLVSQFKAERHAESWSTLKTEVYCVSGRPSEICILISKAGAKEDFVTKFLADCAKNASSFDYVNPKQLCSWAKAKHVIVTIYRSKLCYVFSSNGDKGSVFAFAPVSGDPPATGNLTGLGDAILASFIHQYLLLIRQGGSRDAALDLTSASVSEGIEGRAREFASDVVQHEGATPYAIISFTEKDVRLPLPSRIRIAGIAVTKFIQDWIWLIGILAVFLAWYLGIPLPTRR